MLIYFREWQLGVGCGVKIEYIYYEYFINLYKSITYTKCLNMAIYNNQLILLRL